MSAATTQHDQLAPYRQPVDAVLAALGTDARLGLSQREARARLERYGKNELMAEKPVPAWRKFLAQFHDVLLFTKGAPDVLLARCSRELAGEATRPLSDARRAEILQTNEELAREALRTLGVALRWLPKQTFEADEVDERLEQDLVFAGLIGMIDPPRAEAREAAARAKAAGIRPIMITGDHPVTAAVIAEELGIAANGRAVAGAELEKMPDDMLVQTVQDVSVYARVNPEHKLRIVKA
jgi:P-type Ca2+ transporter type 2C